MGSLRLKIEFGEEVMVNNREQKVGLLKFLYILDSPSTKTIDELIRILEKHIIYEFGRRLHLVQLKTKDGFLLRNSDTCSVVLKDNDHVLCINMNQFVQEHYANLNQDDLWIEVKQHDASDNIEKFISAGLTTDSRFFIQLNGSSEIYELYLFSIYELIRITNEKRQNTLIARISHEDEETPTSFSSNNWFIEARWKHDPISNEILYLICNLKIGSVENIFSSQLEIRIDAQRSRFSKGEMTILSGSLTGSSGLTDEQRERLKELLLKIPATKRTGSDIVIPQSSSLNVFKHECEGESTIRMACGNSNTVVAFQERHASDDTLFSQGFTLTHIIFSKKPLVLPEILQQKRSAPVDKPASISTLSVLYQAYDGSWRECSDIAVAPISVRHEEPRWLTDPVINVEPDKLTSYTIRGWITVKGQIGKDNQSRRRIHKSLPQPLKLKIVLKDNYDRQASLIVEYLNKPLELINRESFIKSIHSSLSEFLALIYVDDCEIDERIHVGIYFNKENALVIRNSTSLSYTFDRKSIRTWEFNARQSKASEMHMDQLHYQYYDSQIKVFFIFDPETWMFYAVRVELATKTASVEETIFVPIEKIQ